MAAPSGEQHELFLAAGSDPAVPHEQHAVVVEVGGGLRTYSVGERDVLDGYPAEAMADGARGQTLAPWPNRIEDGQYAFGGRELQLPLTEVAAGNAIHGLLRWVSWTALERETPSAVTLAARIHPQPGYPFEVGLRVTYTLGDGISVATTASNDGDEAAPFGLGYHPYLSAGLGTVDDLVLTVPATTVLQAGDRGIPSSRGPVDGTPYDFRSGRRIGEVVLDHGFTGLGRDEDEIAVVTLDDPAKGWRTELWMDSAFGHLMVYSGDTLAPGRRRHGLAVEPMTCPPNAFRTGEGVRTLEPGESTTSAWGIRSRPL